MTRLICVKLSRFVVLLFLFLSVFLYWLTHHNVMKAPLFWDEAGVYGNGIFRMIERQISMHPSALSPEISRGHPLLFTCIYASYGKLFGDSIFSLRTCSMIFSFLIVFSIGSFKNFKSNLDWVVPIIMILAQPIFIAQSSLLLPEILLCLLTIITIWAYLNKKLWLYIVAGASIVLTKETGIILIGGIWLFDFLHYLKAKSIREKI